MYEHILIPTDGSELSKIGVEHGLKLAKIHGSRVTAVTVTEPFGGQFAFASELWTPSPTELKSFEDGQRAVANDVLNDVCERAKATGVAVETIHIPASKISRAITSLADELGCSVIVMSSHGRTGMVRAMLGSQAASVSAAASVPVIIAR